MVANKQKKSQITLSLQETDELEDSHKKKVTRL